MDPDVEYEYHAPTQSPINPPYYQACQLKKHNQLAQPQAPGAGGPITAGGISRLEESPDNTKDQSESQNTTRLTDTSNCENVSELGNKQPCADGSDLPDCDETLGATGVDVEKLSLHDT